MASLQAQLQGHQSSIPKVTAFSAIVDLVKDTLPTEMLVSTESPEKRHSFFGGFDVLHLPRGS